MAGARPGRKAGDKRNFLPAALCLILIPLSLIGTFALSLYKGASGMVAAMNAALVFLLTGCFLFSVLDGGVLTEKTLIKTGRPRYFFYVAIAGMVLSLTSGILPEFMIPFAAVGFLLFSLGDMGSALAGLSCYVGTSMLILNESGLYFFELFSLGVILLILFKNRRDEEKCFFRLIIYAQCALISYLAISFRLNMDFSPATVLSPLVGLFLDIVVVLITIPKVDPLRHADERFLRAIGDPEFELFQELKEKDIDEFNRSLHTAVLSERISLHIGANARITKILSFYHRIGALRGTKSSLDAKSLAILREKGFPEDIRKALSSYWGCRGTHLTREAAVVRLMDEVVVAVHSVQMGKGLPDGFVATEWMSGDNITVKSVLEGMAKGLMNRQEILLSDLSIRDLNIIRKRLLAEESMHYYGLLRW
ncbi:MAG: hypothetical protein J6O55_08465 [Lachnospiraceae bacterium]|nr:hypothetical protein [Lachnospiraceae bacterium]